MRDRFGPLCFPFEELWRVNLGLNVSSRQVWDVAEKCRHRNQTSQDIVGTFRKELEHRMMLQDLKIVS